MSTMHLQKTIGELTGPCEVIYVQCFVQSVGKYFSFFGRLEMVRKRNVGIEKEKYRNRGPGIDDMKTWSSLRYENENDINVDFFFSGRLTADTIFDFRAFRSRYQFLSIEIITAIRWRLEQ